MSKSSLHSITYRVFENGRLALEGEISYSLLHLLERSLACLGGRVLELTINGVTHRRLPKILNDAVDASSPYHREMLAYHRLHSLRKLDAEYQSWKETHEKLLAEQLLIDEQRQIANEKMQQDKHAYEIQKQQEFAEKVRLAEENLKLMIERDQLLYDSIVNKQKELLENYAKSQEEEMQRMKLLEQTIIDNLIKDPMTAISALESEVNKSYPVHQQIAKSIDADSAIALLILSSPPSLWDTSYNIMEALALKAKAEPIVAEAVGRALPEDSTVVYMLKKLGYIKTLTP